MAAEGGQSTAKRDALQRIEAGAQQKWELLKAFESNADGPGDKDNKFYGNFPYPYMNGRLHIGHAFSLSKLEFACAFHRLCGKNVLFPQAFHCTGMPIQAAAGKLARELQVYGCPPDFTKGQDGDMEDGNDDAAAEQDAAPAAGTENKAKGKKSKLAAKTAGATQWDILRLSGIPEDEIPAFSDPIHWLEYFPPLAKRDIEAMGCGVDWRRSFVTTEVNPYYDRFIRWQFNTLKAQGRVVKDKRYAIFSPLDNQPCADHDRATGEGVGPQEYVLIKMKALELPGKLAALAGHDVFFLSATLRPETMYGQTNCWVLPEGEYVAVRAFNKDVYVMSQRSALNLSYQDRLPETGKPEVLLTLQGQDLMGVPLSSPHTPHARIYVLPLLTISMGKGTGVVTSVPSDSPDDYRALMDLKEKPAFREKLGIQDEWVMPYEVIPIINIPEFGDTSAVKVCTDLKIKSQNDRAKLEEAKGMTYLKGFTDGVMLVGKYQGQKVQVAKPLIKQEMVEANQAIIYSEPEKEVVSRSGDQCVVALTDQWYLVYGEEEWRKMAEEALSQLETFHPEVRHSFEHTLGWLQQWACSRSFGLGTKLPFDETYLIESLSDSTIYMAFYTVAHILQGGDMYGRPGCSPIPADACDGPFWDYVFQGKPWSDAIRVPREAADACRREFEYWYPFDLRVSGKDLIQNHLTFCLYNHVALFGKDKWPRAFRCNGHLLLNAQKMSKSTGNFKTLSEAVAEFGADALRFGLADAGDSVDDANFEVTVANGAILRMTKELSWIEEVLASPLRDGPPATYADRVFDNAINLAAHTAKVAYSKYLFREALKISVFDLQLARDQYRLICSLSNTPLNRVLVEKYVEVSTLITTPITPHYCEHIWGEVLKKPGLVIKAGWPQVPEPDYSLQAAAAYLERQVALWRTTIAKLESPKKKGPALKVVGGTVVVADEYGGWQRAVLEVAQGLFNPDTRTFVAGWEERAMESLQGHPSLQDKSDKQRKGLVMPFLKNKGKEAEVGGASVLSVRLTFDERQALLDNLDYLCKSLGLRHLHVTSADEGAEGAQEAMPGIPVVRWDTEEVAK